MTIKRRVDAQTAAEKMAEGLLTDEFKESFSELQKSLPTFNTEVFNPIIKATAPIRELIQSDQMKIMLKNIVPMVKIQRELISTIQSSFSNMLKALNDNVIQYPPIYRNLINNKLIEFGWAYPLILDMPALYQELTEVQDKKSFDRYMISIYMRNNGKRIADALKLIEPLVSGRHKKIIKQMSKMLRQDINNYVICYQYLYTLLDYYCSEQVFNHTGTRPNISKGSLKKIVSSDYEIEQNYQDVFNNSTQLLSTRFKHSDWSKADDLETVPLTRHSVLHGKYIQDISFLEFIKLFNLTIFVIYMMSDEDKNKSA